MREPDRSGDRLPEAARRVSAANQNRLSGLTKSGKKTVIGIAFQCKGASCLLRKLLKDSKFDPGERL